MMEVSMVLPRSSSKGLPYRFPAEARCPAPPAHPHLPCTLVPSRQQGHLSTRLSIELNVICMKGARHRRSPTRMSPDSPTMSEKRQSQKAT